MRKKTRKSSPGYNYDEYQKIKEVLEEITFRETFLELIKEEHSYLGKMVLQENFITLHIIYLIQGIDLFINYSIYNALDEDKEYKGFTMIKFPSSDDLISKYTLGKLITFLKQFPGLKVDLIKNLETYNKKRNDLTHKIFKDYKDIKKINRDSKNLVDLGEKILEDLKEIEKYFTETNKILVKKYHLSIHN